MNVKDYAKDINLSVAEVLKKCKELGINASNSEDMLNDDDIIMLDNTLNLISTDDEITYDEDELVENIAKDIMESKNITESNSSQKQKLKKKDTSNEFKDNYKMLKKEMYKHKEKLMSNAIGEDIVLYKNNMTVVELANALNVTGTDIIKKLMSLGLMLGLNDAIDFENAEIVTLDYNKTLKKEETQDLVNFEEFEIIDKEEDLVKRPPIVTIMGHVDHGKTTLLDYIRHSHVVDGEFGGITQHIGAYQINHNGNKITFIDTPGHAAFTEMRARGASVTDIVIIIVAADDGVMPQTKEAIDHAKAANVPIIVAVNKIDKPDANPEKILTEMANEGLTPESWGGEIPFINISAKTGEGIELLLETIETIAEVNDYKSNPNRYATGIVIESKMDKNIGGVASFIIQNGTLRMGDPIVVGEHFGKIRTMRNDLGESIVEAGPSMPVEVTGISASPEAGDKFMAFETESKAKEIAEKRKGLNKSKYKQDVVSLDDLFKKIESGQKEVNVILKADVRGSEEAVKKALQNIHVGDVVVNVIRSGIGSITESDVVLANTSNAIILGFNVVPNNMTKEIAKEYNVDIRLYTIIYKLVEEMELAIKGMLDPEFEEKVIGTVEIRKIFKFSKIGNIAGCYVTDGIVKSNSSVRIIRDGIVLQEDKISSLQREKDSVKEIKKGYECGITLDNYNDIKVGDILEVFELVEVKNA